MAQSHGPQDDDPVGRDAATMAAIADGDDSAFAAVVAAHAPRLLRLTGAILAHDPADAEDVVQETLVRLWEQAGTWQERGRVSTWLQTVAYRLCIDRLRRRRPSVAIDAVADDLVDDAPLPDAQLVHADDTMAVDAAIDALPERQRHALILCHYQGLRQTEAAAVMGIGEEAYESLLARARRRLRAVLRGRSSEGRR